MKGRLIVFEGADGSGKSTQAKLLFAYFKKNKKTRFFSRFRITNRSGEKW